jgi:hypothetical protein
MPFEEGPQRVAKNAAHITIDDRERMKQAVAEIVEEIIAKLPKDSVSPCN